MTKGTHDGEKGNGNRSIEKSGEGTEDMMEKKLEDMIGKNIEGKMEQEIEKQIQTTIGDKMKQMIDAKISEKLGKKIEEKIDEKIEMLGERIEEMIEEKMEDKLKKLMEGKINATIEEQIEKHGNDIMEKINEVMEEKIEEGVEEKIEGKIQETIEEKMEGTIEKIEEELRSKIKEKTAEKTEEMRDGQRGNARKEDEWTTARGGGKRKRSYTERDGQIKLSNRFKVLDPEEQSEKEDVRYLVIGDSRVRAIEKVMCGHRDKCVMKPGGKVEEMEAILKEELGKCDPEVIILNVGVNNVGPRRSVRLEADYLALLRKLREARKPTVITGILPRAAAGNEWYSRALALNAKLLQACENMGFIFVDQWGEFYGRRSYYVHDGLHLSEEGAEALGDAYIVALREN